jgi:ribose transport system permease protein
MNTINTLTAERAGKGTKSGLAAKAVRRVSDAGLMMFLLLSLLFFSVASPHFLSFDNFMNILISVAMIGTVAAGMTMVIVGGGLDLSVASTMALVGSVEAVLVVQGGQPWWVGVGAGLVVGVLVGVMNSVVISYLRVNSIITTLATMQIVRGAAYIYTGGNSIYVSDQALEWFGSGRVVGAPVPAILMMLSFVGVWLVMKYTVFGRYVYAIGGNKVASRLAGINVNRYVNAVFIISGLMAGLAGIMLVGLTGLSVPSAATAYELDVITAVLLGGTSLAGGEGSVWGTLVGVLIIGIINNGMTLLNVPPYWQIAAKGVLLLVAVAIDVMRKRATANT